MRRLLGLTGLFIVATLLLEAGQAQAGRTPGLRTPEERSSGSRSDITVPYLTSGRSPFVTVYVAPLIYSSPIVDDPSHPQAKPVYNIQFYGARQAFGDQQNGATQR